MNPLKMNPSFTNQVNSLIRSLLVSHLTDLISEILLYLFSELFNDFAVIHIHILNYQKQANKQMSKKI